MNGLGASLKRRTAKSLRGAEMLVPFAIDAGSLAPDASWTPSDVDNHHRSLFKAWQTYGLLCVDGDSLDGSKLISAVRMLPQNIRPRWMGLLEKLPIQIGGTGWRGTIDTETLATLGDMARLALVDDARAEVEFEIAEDAQSTDIDGIEVCRLKSAEHAHAFEQAAGLADARIPKGTPSKQVWDTRFRSLARAPIKKITIVDRYAVEQHLKGNRGNRRGQHGASARSLGWQSGLERFLRDLDRDAGGNRYVTLYSSRTRELQELGISASAVRDELERVLRALPNRRIKKLLIHLPVDGMFSKLAHGRYIRFERYVWDIDLGLQTLEGGFSPASVTASFKTGDPIDGYRANEDALRTDRGTVTQEVRP